MELHWQHPEVFAEADRRLAKDRIRELARDHGDLREVRIVARPVVRDETSGQEVCITGAACGRLIVAAGLETDPGLALTEGLDAFEREVCRHCAAASGEREAPDPPAPSRRRARR